MVNEMKGRRGKAIYVDEWRYQFQYSKGGIS
jgi:hypothetical protein